MEQFFSNLEHHFTWFAICAALFVTIAWLLPHKKTQKLRRAGIPADVFYWFVGPFLYNPLLVGFITLMGTVAAIRSYYDFSSPYLSSLPLWLQCVLILLITDFIQYWLHRGFHHDPLWKYHAIHHSGTEVDWLTSTRFHPVNIVLYSTFINALVMVLGFDGEAFAMLIPFNTLYSPWVHTNVNVTYGPLKYVFASPVFHRWHHTYPDEGGNRNFAPTFSFLDVMFGTFYMPEGKTPEKFGIEGNPVPEHVLGQLAYPFKEIMRKAREDEAARPQPGAGLTK